MSKSRDKKYKPPFRFVLSGGVLLLYDDIFFEAEIICVSYKAFLTFSQFINFHFITHKKAGAK